MSHDEAFSLRHRGVHVPDHLRRLELISAGGSSPRSHGNAISISFRPLVLPQAKRDIIPKRSTEEDADDSLANFFGNITVWIQNALNTATAHAGYDKIHLYVTILKAFVEFAVPHEAAIKLVADIEDYVSYLSASVASSPTVPHALVSAPRPVKPVHHQPRRPEAHVAKPPTQALSPRAAMNTVLSPRAIRAMAKEVAEEASASSPRIVKRRPKKIIELTAHEESILELALFFDEAAAQLEPTVPKRAKKTKGAFTQQWLVMPSEERTRLLKKIKAGLRKETFFGAHGNHVSVPTSPSAIPGVELSSYFSLVLLSLQETTRRIGVFSAQAAAFMWKNLYEETLGLTEKILEQVITVHRQAADELERLKLSRHQVQEAIVVCERDIQRLQAQNVLSLSVWKLENEEMEMLEREEEWHGHCKILILKTLAVLRDEVHEPTWLQVRDRLLASEGTESDASSGPAELTYHRLPTGAALLHGRLRSRIMYVTHLVLLCRSFLHLHEKKGLREVMESTSTNPRWLGNAPPSPQPLATFPENLEQLVVPSTPLHGHSSSAMEHISTSELLTLKEINNTLRAIEQLYVCCGGSGGTTVAADSLTASESTSVGRGHDVATQFPTVNETGDGTARGPYAFVRSLSYSTMAATPSSNAPPFLPAGSTASAPATRRRNAEIAVSNMPVGSGRRRSSAVRGQGGGETNSQPTQPSIRLTKTMHKLPRHVKDLLISPLLEADPFPATDPASITESLAIPEILGLIQWLYGSIIDASFPPWASGRSNDPHGSDTAIPLLRHLWKSWKSEQFVAFIHAAFIAHADDDIKQGERAFITFLASVQLLFSGLGAALNPTTGGSGPSHAMEKIYFFARMARLFNLEARDKLTKNRLPAHTFLVFFYCTHVLQHVSILKKHIEEGGLTIDVWTAAASHTGEKKPASPSRVTAASRRDLFRHPIPPPSNRFVLLESVKTLLMYLLESTSPDVALVIDECVTFLTDRSTLARVSLLSPTIPGAYDTSNGSAVETPPASTQVPVANGDLVDVLILPLDFAVQAITNTWLRQHKALLDRLSVAMRAADIQANGEISFDEFKHVITLGSAAPAAVLANSPITTGQLTQIYASLLGECSHGRGVKWQALLVAVADEIDLLGTGGKLVNTDLRAIQRALLHSRGVPPSPWVTNVSYRGGDTATLRKVWELNHLSMKENFSLTIQADSALEGISLWQSGSRRLAHVEKLVVENSRATKTPRSRSRQRRSSIVAGLVSPTGVVGARHNEEPLVMTKDELDVAWRALYYLQLDHTQAHHIADQVRVKAQRSARNQPSIKTESTASRTS